MTLRAITTALIFEAGRRQHRLVCVERADRDRAILEAAAALDAHDTCGSPSCSGARRAAPRWRSRVRASVTSSDADRSGIRFGMRAVSRRPATMKVRTLAESTEVTPSGEICATRPSK